MSEFRKGKRSAVKDHLKSTKNQKDAASRLITEGVKKTIKTLLESEEFCHNIINGNIKADDEFVSLKFEKDGHGLLENHEDNRQTPIPNDVTKLAASIEKDGQQNPINVQFYKFLLKIANGWHRLSACIDLGRAISATIKVGKYTGSQISTLNESKTQTVMNTIYKYWKQGIRPYENIYDLHTKAVGKGIICDINDVYALGTGIMVVAKAAKKLEEKKNHNNNDKLIIKTYKDLVQGLNFVHRVIKSGSIVATRKEGYKTAFYPLYALGYEFRKKNNIDFKVDELIDLLADPSIREKYDGEIIHVRSLKRGRRKIPAYETNPFDMEMLWTMGEGNRTRNFVLTALIKIYQENIENVELCSQETLNRIISGKCN